MRLEMTNGDSLLLTCWSGVWDKERGDFKEICLHLVVRNNHLLICENGWKELLMKEIKHPMKKRGWGWYGELDKELLKKKGKTKERLAIDLTHDELCGYMRVRFNRIKKAGE